MGQDVVGKVARGRVMTLKMGLCKSLRLRAEGVMLDLVRGRRDGDDGGVV